MTEGFKVDKADAGEWAERQLAALSPGHTTVLYHSVFWQYLDEATQQRIRTAAQGAGAQASDDTPFAWLSMELQPEKQCAGLFLRLWPGGEKRLLADCDPHGKWIRWLAAEAA